MSGLGLLGKQTRFEFQCSEQRDVVAEQCVAESVWNGKKGQWDAPAFDDAGYERSFAVTRIDIEHVWRCLFDAAGSHGGGAARIGLVSLMRHLCLRPSTVPLRCASDSPSVSSPDIS